MWETDRIADNFRDLSGLPTMDGHRIVGLLRSGHPSGPAVRAVRAGSIARVVDLRWAAECSADPSPFAGHPVYRHRPMLNDVLGYDPPADTYAPLLDHNAARIAAVVDAVATAPPGPVLVHCFGGCDRTGVLVALLLSVAGVAPGIIAADFARSPGRDAAAMVTTLRHLTSAYGGAAAYLGRSGVDDATLRTVAARFRDD